MTEMNLQADFGKGSILKEGTSPLTDAMEGMSLMLGPAAICAKEGLLETAMAFIHTILIADRAKPIRRGGFSHHQQVDVVLEFGLPLPKVVILTLHEPVSFRLQK